MKKLFLIFFLFFSFENVSYSQDLNEILKRLDKIAFEDNSILEF